jgi:hypothetical protein
MRAFLYVRTVEIPDEIGSSEASVIELVYSNSYRWAQLEEVQRFFTTAVNGDVFQFQDNECILALGNLIKASWMR